MKRILLVWLKPRAYNERIRPCVLHRYNTWKLRKLFEKLNAQRLMKTEIEGITDQKMFFGISQERLNDRKMEMHSKNKW